jgi:serine/threonine protein kinase
MEEEFLNIFLEYVPGGSVTTLLRNYGAFEEPLVKNFVRQILVRLVYLHERDIIHRDIKGVNIFLVDNKGGIKISDFGISKKVEDSEWPCPRGVFLCVLIGLVVQDLMGGNRVHRPSLQGSVFWMAPEVVKQTEHTTKADIWSVGCLVVEMLTGEHPWAQLSQMQAIFKVGRAFSRSRAFLTHPRSGPPLNPPFRRTSRQRRKISCNARSSLTRTRDRARESCCSIRGSLLNRVKGTRSRWVSLPKA